MQHAIPWPLCQHIMHVPGISQVSLDQPGRRRDRGAMSLRQVVEHHDFMPLIKQREHDVAADKAGPASHQIPL